MYGRHVGETVRGYRARPGRTRIVTVPHSRTFIMRNRRVHDQVVSFLRSGCFQAT